MAKVDFIEAGSGPLVVLVHSSMAGARQWTALMDDLKDRFRVRAVNLYGYGRTPAWSERRPPSLDDFADLVATALPDTTESVSLVGHSFGGAVAMQVTRRSGTKVNKLALFEPSIFYLLGLEGRAEAFAEISALSEQMKDCAAAGAMEDAAERFIDYWAGPGTWASSPDHKQAAYARAVDLVLREWDAVLAGTTTLHQWAGTLPAQTMIVSSATTTRPAAAVADVLSTGRTDWQVKRIGAGGHMAPLTHPEIVNPIIGDFLAGQGVD